MSSYLATRFGKVLADRNGEDYVWNGALVCCLDG